MKKLKIALASVFALTCFGYSNIYANDGMFDQDVSGELTNGYRDFGERKNPNSREFYNGFSRESTWYLSYNKTIYTATKKSGNGTAYAQYYIPALNRTIGENYFDKDSDITEVYDITPRQVTFNKARKKYTYPIFRSEVGTLPAGTYTVYKAGCEWLYLDDGTGEKYWVNANYSAAGKWEKDSESYFQGVPEKLSVNNIRGIPIKFYNGGFIPIRENNRANSPMVPAYVTIHNTASTGAGANAFAHARIQYNGNSGQYASWHFQVDNKEIYQSIPLNEIGYHAGDGMSQGNGRTIAIEICENSDGNYAVAERNAALLTARILYDNGLPPTAVKRHYDWSGKDCPHNMIYNTKGTMGWNGFLKAVADEYAKIQSENDILEEDKVAPKGSEKFLEAGDLNYSTGTVSGIELNTDVSKLVEKIQKADSEAKITILDKNGKEKNTGIIVTKDKLNIILTDGTEFTFDCIIRGDVNGDGEITPSDYVLIRNYIRGKRSLDMTEKLASNINRDNQVTPSDYVLVRNHIRGKYTIEQ